jgi:A/G-specific adenine glycosylase
MQDSFATAVTRWYAGAARDLPWRRRPADPWAVLVSEIMLQQTPVSRVLPVWTEWMRRWPTPPDLADESAGEAVRAWGRLGYPRRALRLHATARAVTADHGGVIPPDPASLRALPGVGDYTAAAVAAFAFGARTAVLDTNVRRVYARVFDGVEIAARAPTVRERADALDRVPFADPAGYALAVMELGALVCTARTPDCAGCPVSAHCAWLRHGRRRATEARRSQRFTGTDRQARGRLLAVLRESTAPVEHSALVAAWPEPMQRGRALHGLIADGLVQPLPDDRYRLPA